MNLTTTPTAATPRAQAGNIAPSPIYTDKPAKAHFYHLKQTPSAALTIPAPGQEAKPYPCYFVQLNDEHKSRIAGAWSGHEAPPAIGERVLIKFNGFGPGVVVGYFVESGFLGVEVKCDNRPAWHIKQNGDKHPHPLVFGAEIARITTTPQA